MISEQKIVEECIAGKRLAHNLLYRKYASKMLGVCMRYCKNKQEAEDVLQDGFIKVFFNIKNFRKEGSFEGWIRKIMINTALNNYQSNLKHSNHSDIDDIEEFYNFTENEENFNSGKILPNNQLMRIIQSLPCGYRMVFNLYGIEGYTHKEIAGLLNISENTSKSQLSKARKFLKKKIIEVEQKMIISK